MIRETEISLGAKRKVSPGIVVMLKSEANYTYVYLADGTRFLSTITLGILEKRLEDFNFLRPNRSILINKHFIESFSTVAYVDCRPNIRLLNQTIIPIAKRKIKDIRKAKSNN